METTGFQQVPPEAQIPEQSGFKKFYQKHKLTFNSFVIVVFLFVILEILAGGSPIVECIVTEANPFAGFNIGSCPTEVGQKTLVVQLCNTLANGQAHDICVGSYAIENNKPQICEQLDDQLTTGKSHCIEGLAIKNKNISLCDSLPISRETCRNAVRYDLFYNGENKNKYVSPLGQWDMCPGNDPAFWQDGYEETCKARKNPELTVCDTKQDEEKMDCYLEVAEKIHNPKLCQAFGKNMYGQYDLRIYQCLSQISKDTKSVNYCNLMPQEQGAGILPMASCYQNVLGLSEGQLRNSTTFCNLVTDTSNRDRCHALLSYLDTYYSMLYLQPEQRTEKVSADIRQKAVARCKTITDAKIKEWCQNTLSNYTLTSGTAIEPSNFPE